MQLFGLAAQHFLLPALLGALRVVALLLGQLFLAARELIQFLQRFVDFFLLLAGRAARRLRCLVLILFGVELQIEQAREVAPSAAARSASAARTAEGHLNLAERGLGAQQILKRLLFAGHGFAPFLLLQFFGGRTHRFRGRVHVFHEAVEFLIFMRQFAALHAPGER